MSNKEVKKLKEKLANDDVLTKEPVKLVTAKKEMGEKLKPILAWFNTSHQPQLSTKRNEFIKIAYDYIKVLRKEDSNSDNHSFSKITKTIFDSVGLNQKEYNSLYFRKFANECVRGALLLHWQDIGQACSIDESRTLSSIRFAKKRLVNWQVNEHKKIKENGKSVAWRIQHVIEEGELCINWNVFEPVFVFKGGVIKDNDNKVAITFDTNIINTLYNLFKDPTQNEQDQNQGVQDSTEDTKETIDALNTAGRLVYEATIDPDFVQTLFLKKSFLKARDYLKEQLNNLDTVRESVNQSDEQDYQPSSKKKEVYETDQPFIG